MARIRTLKPEFTTSQSTGALSREARLFFVQLLTEADDYGRLVYSPKRLAGVLYPWDDDVEGAQIERWTKECQKQGMLRRYSGVIPEDLGKPQQLVAIVNWDKHQRVSHRTDSRLPPPPPEQPEIAEEVQVADDSGAAPEKIASPPENRGADLGSRNLDLGSRKEIAPPKSAGADVVPIHPPEEASKYDDVTIALARATNTNLAELTKAGRGSFFTALAELKKTGATAQQVMARSMVYKRKFPADTALTAPSLAKHWATLGGDPLAPKLDKRTIDGMTWAARKQAEQDQQGSA